MGGGVAEDPLLLGGQDLGRCTTSLGSTVGLLAIQRWPRPATSASDRG
jgi:hypothetical protein